MKTNGESFPLPTLSVRVGFKSCINSVSFILQICKSQRPLAIRPNGVVPFDVVAGGDCVISNSGGVTYLRKGFNMLNLSVMQLSLCFSDIESVTIPETCSVYDLRFMRAIQTIFARKKGLNPASVLKNQPKIDKTIKFINTRFKTAFKNVALET